MLNVSSQDFRQRTALFRLKSFEATAEEFVPILELCKAVGGDLKHMASKNGALGVALVMAGASTYFFRNHFRKRALAMGADARVPLVRRLIGHSFYSACLCIGSSRHSL